MPETVSKDIRLCKCGKNVAWLYTPMRGSQPYEIKREILTGPDGTRTVIVSTEDIHYCGHYPGLADFLRKAIDRSSAKKIRIRLPTKELESVVLLWNRGDTAVNVSNGKTGNKHRSYGSLNIKTGGYRVEHRSSSLQNLLELVDLKPFKFDWSGGGSQTTCCYCGRLLNDPRSVRWGYGPTCAKNLGLPWW
jgi:hypothetical protein